MCRQDRLTACVIGCVMATLFLSLAGCGKEKVTRPKDDGDSGQAASYFPLYVGYQARYRVLHSAYDSIGTTRFAVVNTFTTPQFSGFVAVDSSFEGIDTLWLTTNVDTVFSLAPRLSYAQRQPIVRNHDNSDFSWPLYTVGTPGSVDRYTVIFHQRPQTETVYSPRGNVYARCGRSDLLAVYEQSGDTVVLGTEYFAPDIGRVLSTFRPFVQSTQYTRDLIR